MRSSRTKDFRKLFIKLPEQVRETAKKNYEFWQENPFHQSLEFKQVKPNQNIWSVLKKLMGVRAIMLIA